MTADAAGERRGPRISAWFRMGRQRAWVLAPAASHPMLFDFIPMVTVKLEESRNGKRPNS